MVHQTKIESGSTLCRCLRGPDKHPPYRPPLLGPRWAAHTHPRGRLPLHTSIFSERDPTGAAQSLAEEAEEAEKCRERGLSADSGSRFA